MAELNFGGVIETVMTREEFPLEKAREILKNETIAVLGYGVQGPGQACNLRDNGFNVIVGQRQGKTYDKAVADGILDYVTGTNLTYRMPELLTRDWYVDVDVSKYAAYFVVALNHDMSVSSIIDPIKKIEALLASRK